jgi:thiosulfate dehydrogenase
MPGQVDEELKKLRREIAGDIERNQYRLLNAGAAIALTVAGAAAAAVAFVAIMPSSSTSNASMPEAEAAAFASPALSDIPAGPEGDAIRRGMAIFDDPRSHAAQFVGNAMACKNCHLDSGRRANSSPMWAAWVA